MFELEVYYSKSVGQKKRFYVFNFFVEDKFNNLISILLFVISFFLKN